MSDEIHGREGLRLLDRFRHLDEAVQRKIIKFGVSGIIIIVLGLFLITFGVMGGAILLTGFGALAVLMGVVSLLIGFINPSTPQELEPPLQPSEEVILDDYLFEKEEESD
ncbi:MAG: DUF308 domain-containing protein [Ktedonobacteraceae bacterium]|nr:DUF308 domain-containing protein [Ktedonobacteraceae bacterium]